MKRQLVIANSLLWAAAILAAAIVHAPAVLTLILLPCLATGFVLSSQATGRPARASTNTRTQAHD